MKFSIIRSIFTKLLVFSMMTFCMFSIAKTTKKTESSALPKVSDLKQDFLTQNTARHVLENGLAKSDIENNPSRYKILTAAQHIQNNMVNVEVYPNDPKPYYGGQTQEVFQNKKFTLTPKNFADANSRYENKNIYKKDQRPYYGIGEEFKIISNAPNDKVAVPIELKELTYTFADNKNIKSLEQSLEKINGKESLNNISTSGKYMKDPRPYYDAGAYDRAVKTNKIIETIKNFKEDLKNTSNQPVFTEENFPVKTKVQNIINASKEDSNNLIANSYYYDVNRKTNGPAPHAFNIIEEAEAEKHNVVEVEIAGVSLGDKYYENERQPILAEAEVKDNSNFKNVEAVAKNSSAPTERKMSEKIAEKTKTKDKPKEKVLEKTGEINKNKKDANLRTEPLFEGFKHGMGKIPNDDK